MSNVNAPHGLKPIRHMAGGIPRLSVYTILSTYNTAIYTGDVVELYSTSNQINQAAAANPDNLGVFAGCSWTDASGAPQWSPYWPGTQTGATDIKAYVYDDPMIVFEAQVGNSTTTGLNIADLGQLFDWVVAAGSTKTGISGNYINPTPIGTAGGSLRILRPINAPDNAVAAAGSTSACLRVECMFAEHVLNPNADSGTIAGAGGI